MQTKTVIGTFSPHPGTIVFRAEWNHSERTEQAADVPDGNKFVYYDASGQETADSDHAIKRVPIVEVDMTSYDKDGNLVDPRRAARISISEFGPNHSFLRHTSGPGGPH